MENSKFPGAGFGAGLFVEWTLTPITVLNCCGAAPAVRDVQRLLECGRILQDDVRLQGLAVIDHAEAFYDVQFFAMRRPIIVDEGLCVCPIVSTTSVSPS